MPSFPVLVLGVLFVSFRPSRSRSHSRSTGACLALSPSAFSLPLRFLSSASLPVLTTQPSVSSVPFFPALPLSGSSGARFFLSASPFSAFSSARFPVLPSRLLVLGSLFVSFRPSRSRSHSRSTGASLPLCFLSSASLPGFSACLSLPFVRFGLLLTTQPSALSFPVFPISPDSGSLGALSSSVRPVSMPSVRFRYSAFCVSFLRPPFRLTVATSAPPPFPLRVSAFSPWLSL